MSESLDMSEDQQNEQHQQHQRHPLNLETSAARTIEKLIQHSIILKSSSNETLSINPELNLQIPSQALFSTVFKSDVKKLRQNSQETFWSSRNGGSIIPSIDRVRIDDNMIQKDDPHHPNISDDSSDVDFNAMTSFQFKQKYLYRNVPCIIENISLPITNQWYKSINDSTPAQDQGHNCGDTAAHVQTDIVNTQWFLDNIGEDTIVPVRINQEGYEDGRAAECLTSKMTMKEWIQNQRYDPKYYLKDWHMQSIFQEMYKTPAVFDDVLNPFLLENEGGDYRFVYWGCKGSKTGIHADVLNSFSWSYNVVGKKRWTFYHPDDLSGTMQRATVVIQQKGEMLFVPSGWRHSVENLEETISVNHNWIMAGALDCILACIIDEIKAIEGEMHAWGMMSTEINDVVSINRMREDMLRGCVGMDVTTFTLLVLKCFTECLVTLVIDESAAGDDNKAEVWFDFICVKKVLGYLLELAKEDSGGKDAYVLALHHRLISTLGHNLGSEVLNVIHMLNSDMCIGCNES